MFLAVSYNNRTVKALHKRLLAWRSFWHALDKSSKLFGNKLGKKVHFKFEYLVSEETSRHVFLFRREAKIFSVELFTNGTFSSGAWKTMCSYFRSPDLCIKSSIV